MFYYLIRSGGNNLWVHLSVWMKKYFAEKQMLKF